MQAIAEFSKGSSGRKIFTEKAATHPGVRAEVYDYVSRCESILTGESPSTYCTSEPVFTQSKMCSAAYSVTQRAGEGRHTNVLVTCKTGERSSSGALIAELEGQHETIGFAWTDESTVEVLLPPGVKTLRKQAESYGKPAQKFVYRNRKPTDAPATACVRNPEFLDPATKG